MSFRFNFDNNVSSTQGSDHSNQLPDTTEQSCGEEVQEIQYCAEVDHKELETVYVTPKCELVKGVLASSCVAELLRSPAVGASDLLPGEYEGGFKLWECAIDLLGLLSREWRLGAASGPKKLTGARVLELGCGHGLPGVLAAMQGAETHFQDYNAAVLTHLTVPNVAANLRAAQLPNLLSRPRFFAGSWAGLRSAMHARGLASSYDLILSTDTIYNVDSYRDLINCITEGLKPGGVAYVAAKSYYFGVGGSTAAFREAAVASRSLEAEVAWRLADGTSNVREILRLRKGSA